MSMKSIIMTTTGAAAGMILGNYLYETDKKANAEMETPIPFYTVRKAAEDISKKAEETYNDIKDKICKKKEDVTTEEVTDSTTTETVEKVEAEVIEAEKEDNKEINESDVIDVEVVGDKAVPADQEIKQEETEETKAEEATVEPIIPNTEETVMPKFTIVDAPAAPAETQAPETKETGTTKKPTSTKKSTKKAEK